MACEHTIYTFCIMIGLSAVIILKGTRDRIRVITPENIFSAGIVDFANKTNSIITLKFDNNVSTTF